MVRRMLRVYSLHWMSTCADSGDWQLCSYSVMRNIVTIRVQESVRSRNDYFATLAAVLCGLRGLKLLPQRTLRFCKDRKARHMKSLYYANPNKCGPVSPVT